MLKRIGIVLAVVTMATFLVAVGCKKRSSGTAEEKTTEGPTKPVYKATGNEGTITGKVSYDGPAPELKKIDMSGDANCAAAAGDKTVDDIVVTDGKLANVFVYLKGGVTEKNSFETPSEPVVLDQQGCRYHPRVFGIQVNQTFKVTNSDKTTHNIHPSPKTNPEWNK